MAFEGRMMLRFLSATEPYRKKKRESFAARGKVKQIVRHQLLFAPSHGHTLRLDFGTIPYPCQRQEKNSNGIRKRNPNITSPVFELPVSHRFDQPSSRWALLPPEAPPRRRLLRLLCFLPRCCFRREFSRTLVLLCVFVFPFGRSTLSFSSSSSSPSGTASTVASPGSSSSPTAAC